MKHLMKSSDFFSQNESRITDSDIKRAYTHSRTVKEFIQKTKNKTSIWDFIFKGRSRIYFDMGGNELDKREIIRDAKEIILNMNDISDLDKIENSDTVIYTDIKILKDIVTKCLKENGFVYIDFDNNKCSKDPEGIKNITSITSVLSRKNIRDVYKKIDLLNKYNQRNNKSVFNKPVSVKEVDKDDKKYMMVFSIHPIDLLAMSTNRPWEQQSCMRIGGYNEHYVYADIKNGSVVCYQTEYGDFNITKPNARLLYKPYINENDTNEYILFSDANVYGTEYENFREMSLCVIDSEFNYLCEAGVFDLHCELYNDGQSSRISKDMRDYNRINDISLNNFYDVYTKESASVSLFNYLYDETAAANDDILGKLLRVYEDLENDEKVSVYMKFLTKIETYFEWSGDENDFKNEYLPLILHHCGVDIMYAYFVIYKVLGMDYVNQHYRDFDNAIFSNIKSFTRTYSSDMKYEALYNMYKEYESVDNEINEFYEIYDDLPGRRDLEDVDNGYYIEYDSTTWIYDNITVKDGKLMILVDFGRNTRITLEELKEHLEELKED